MKRKPSYGLFAYFHEPIPVVTISIGATICIVLALQFLIIGAISQGFHDRLFPLDFSWWKKPWTLFTSRLAHRNLAHLSNNVQGLILLGPLVERWLGRSRFLFFFVAGAVIAGVGGLYLDAYTQSGERSFSSVGSSTGIWAIMGFSAIGIATSWGRGIRNLGRGCQHLTGKKIDSAIRSYRVHELIAGIIILYQLWGLAQWNPVAPGVGQVGNAAHLVGFVVGFGAGLAWLKWKGSFSVRNT